MAAIERLTSPPDSTLSTSADVTAGELRVPAVALPLLRKPHTHNAYSEID